MAIVRRARLPTPPMTTAGTSSRRDVRCALAASHVSSSCRRLPRNRQIGLSRHRCGQETAQRAGRLSAAALRHDAGGARPGLGFAGIHAGERRALAGSLAPPQARGGRGRLSNTSRSANPLLRPAFRLSQCPHRCPETPKSPRLALAPPAGSVAMVLADLAALDDLPTLDRPSSADVCSAGTE